MNDKFIRFGLAQVNVIMGDFQYNKTKIITCIKKAKEQNIDCLVFPECSICGYPPEDLIYKKSFLEQNLQILNEIILETSDICIVIGFIDYIDDKIFNAAAIISNKKIVEKYYKQELPNYGVFEEKRYFTKGQNQTIFSIGFLNCNITICEDIWTDKLDYSKNNFDITINLSASPYWIGKSEIRQSTIKKYAKKTNSKVLYCNLVGGQDELIFDGNSFVMDEDGVILEEAEKFEEEILVFDCFNKNHKVYNEKNISKKSILKSNRNLDIYNALVLGTKDYVIKNGFKKVAIGLSGGIDSALVAKIAVDAIGKENVICVSMPTIYSSIETQNDAEVLAKNLGVTTQKHLQNTALNEEFAKISPHKSPQKNNLKKE